MLSISSLTTIASAIVSLALLLPSPVSAASWVYTFSPCPNTAQDLAADLVYATTPNEAPICTVELMGSYKYTLVDDNTITRAKCSSDSSLDSPFPPETYNRYGSSSAQCGQLSSFSTKAFTIVDGLNGADAVVTASAVAKSLPSLDYFKSASAVSLKFSVRPTASLPCFSKALSIANIIPIFETCTKIADNSYAISVFDADTRVQSTTFAQTICRDSSCSSCSGLTANNSKPPSKTLKGKCRASFGQLDTIEFPGVPLSSSSKYPTDDPKLSVTNQVLQDKPVPDGVSVDTAFHPLTFKDAEPPKIATTDPFAFPTAFPSPDASAFNSETVAVTQGSVKTINVGSPSGPAASTGGAEGLGFPKGSAGRLPASGLAAAVVVAGVVAVAL
ncbi:hypothetical protein HDU97_007338 [Phlyctochytrium planicorne]|nr:hypothetical protein HDU97_007338 [Phlyctochytrium planicorne]